ncbi:MAG: hypothetical protein KGM47_06055, partial [Acidobacteriota bacterium]|nr:hypothetical protein [Acidobacteriota bacterium]
MNPFRTLPGFLIILFALALATQIFAASAPNSRLGEVHFPISCSAAVQNRFNTAVALLHSFQYNEAEQAFSGVAEQDPHCAMAYWGKAMSLYHQLWDFPNAVKLKEGREDLRKAEELGAKTARERGYIAAAAAFYQDDPSLSPDARTEAYSKAMDTLHQQDPGDVNAAAFYALSLVALAQDGIVNIANRRHAIAILQPLFAAHPENPGIDHYLIHASDDPRLARFGLAAARNYARIAPDSAHALHMPSHIFTRLGYWQDSIQSNLASAAAAEEATRSGRDNEWGHQLHALTFLEYANLQSGQDAAARNVIEEVTRIPGTSAKELEEDQLLLRATYFIETHQWKQAAALKLLPGDGFPRDQWQVSWTRTIGAARSGNASQARLGFQKLRQAGSFLVAKAKNSGYNSAGIETAQLEAEAWLEYAEGRHDEAMRTMRKA